MENLPEGDVDELAVLCPKRGSLYLVLSNKIYIPII